MSEIDALDLELLDLLRKDARRTYSDMASEVGLSVAAVKRRVDRLRETGVIVGFTALVDHSKLGMAVEAFTELRYAGTTRTEEIVKSAWAITEVHAIYTIAGDPDALVHLRVRDLHHLQETIDRLRRTGNVVGTKTLMVLGAWTKDG